MAVVAHTNSIRIHNLSSLLPPFSSSSLRSQSQISIKNNNNNHSRISKSFKLRYRFSARESEEDEDENHRHSCSFEEAVELFNNREFYRCHDCLETIWNDSEEPRRTLIHGVLQCAVGFYHLLNHNHKGAMMELGEGLCKIRKMNFDDGPFRQFELEISSALDFLYQTQLQLAACAEDMCVAMDRSERSYQLLGDYAAGQHIYHLEGNPVDGIMNVVFQPPKFNDFDKFEKQMVKLPTLNATQRHFMVL